MKNNFSSIIFSFVFLAIGFSSVAVKAQKAGLTVGLSQVQIEGSSGVTVDSNGSYQAGALFYQPFNEPLSFRMGAFFAKEMLTIKTGGVDTKLDLLNINVPLTLGYGISDRFLLFAGPVLSVNASKSCSSSLANVDCNVSDLKVKGTDILLSLGTHFQLTEELGMELSYDRMGGKPFENTSSGQLINVNFQYIIE